MLNNSEEVWKKSGKVPKSVESAETILPFSCCPLVFFLCFFCTAKMLTICTDIMTMNSLLEVSFVVVVFFFFFFVISMRRGNESIYLHRSGPLLENGLDRPKNRYGRYGFPSFYSISISTVGVEGARVFLWRFSFFAVWVVVVDISQFPDANLRASDVLSEFQLSKKNPNNSVVIRECLGQ